MNPLFALSLGAVAIVVVVSLAVCLMGLLDEDSSTRFKMMLIALLVAIAFSIYHIVIDLQEILK